MTFFGDIIFQETFKLKGTHGAK
ncbi:uncharacterized protein METZ01_LOCUS338585 [marine metagenome]|uniref:Uncharacterized protein n=1 Tax=marine metagenome TaxID=408172 RepID=A0A382QN19_9ZZZZ